MPFANGVISRNTSTTPNQGVSIYDVQRALQRGTSDLGLLCSDQEWRNGSLSRVYKVNQWAKYKSERNSKLGLLTLADRQDNYFGLDITPSKGGAAALGALISRFDSEWSYLPPRGKGNGTGGANEWFRIRDFEGYNTNANSFINNNDLTLPDSTIVGQAMTFHIGLNTGNNLNTNSISIQEWMLGGSEGTPFSELYGGLIFVSGSTYKLLTSPYQLGESNQSYSYAYGTEITLPAPSATASYMVYPVLSVNKYLSLSDTGNTDTIISLPLSAFSFTIESEVSVENLYIGTPTAKIESGGYAVSFKFKLGGTMYPSISNVTYYIKTATAYEDRSGTTKKTATLSGTFVSGTYYQVGPLSIKETPPSYVYIKVEDTNRPAVYAEAWARPREGGMVPDPPTPEEIV